MSTYTDLHNRIKENVTILRKPGSKDDGMSPQKVILINPENQFYGTFNGAMNIKSGTLSDLTFVGGTIDGAKIKNATFLDGDVEVPIGEIAAAVDSHEQRLTQAEADIKAISAAHDALSAGLSSAVDDLSAGIEEKIDAAIEGIEQRISGFEDLSSDVIGLSTALSGFVLNGVVYKGALSAYHDKYDNPGQLFGDNPACCLLEGRQIPLKNGWMWRVHIDPANVSGYVVVEDKTGKSITLGESDYIIIKSHIPSEHEVIPDEDMLLDDFDVIDTQDGDDAKLSAILKLSSEVKDISANLCAEISGLSSSLAETISSEVIELADQKYVKKLGDAISALTVDNDLVVGGATLLNDSLSVIAGHSSLVVDDDEVALTADKPIQLRSSGRINAKANGRVTVETQGPIVLSGSNLSAHLKNQVHFFNEDGLGDIYVNGKSVQSTLDDLSNALDESKFDKDFGEQVSSQMTAIQKYVDELSGPPGSEGIVKYLSDEISVLRQDEKFELQLNKVDFWTPEDADGRYSSIGHFLSALLEPSTYDVRNNTGYVVEFGASVPLSTKILISDGRGTTIGHGDIIYIHELSSVESAPIRIPFAKLQPYDRANKSGNTFILQAGVARHEFEEQAKNLSDEIETRKSDDAFLSNVISTKIWIEDRANDPSDISGYSDLSVVKISKDEYDDLAIGPTRLCANVLYVVESDYVDAYGQDIRNVLSSDEATNAATVGQVGAAKAELCTYAGEISAQASRELSGKRDYMDLSYNTTETVELPALHATMTSQQGGQVIVEYDLLCTKDVPNPPQIGDIYTWRADSAAFYITQGVSVYQTRWILYSYTGEELGGVTTQNVTQGFYPDVEFRPSNAVITIHKTTVQKQVTNEDTIALESKTVPTVRTVNGKPLSADVELTGADIAYNASTTIAAKLSSVDSAFAEHVADKNNPHGVTKAQIIQAGSITTADIASKAITNDKLADNSVSDSKLQGDGNNGITSTHFKTNAFHGAKLVDGTVTAAKLGEDVDAKFASKSDATLTECGPNKDGFSAWTIFREGVDVTAQITEMPHWINEADAWLVQNAIVPGDSSAQDVVDAGQDALYLNWKHVDGTGIDVVYTATRTALPGYQLGNDDQHILASEAEAEALRTQLEQKLSVDNTPANVNMVHISQEDYEQYVFDGSALSNTLYVVSGDYINAYGETIQNVVMTDDPEESEAATQHYVLSGLARKQDTIDDLADIRSNAANALPKSISSDFVLKSQIQDALSAISADPLSGLTYTSMLSDVISSVVVVRNMLSALWTTIS